MIFVDQEITVLPDAIVNLYHSRVRKVDLSFNSMNSLDGLEFFSRLEELILDNNQLGDNIRIPKTQSITTLSLNNNKVIHVCIHKTQITASIMKNIMGYLFCLLLIA